MDIKQFAADKILGHLDRIIEWLETGLSRPITCELFMTNVCNQKCPHCFGFYNRVKHREMLEEDEAKAIIYQIKELGIRGLTFTGGGEPLCNPATADALEFAKTIGLDAGIITNGLCIDRKIARVLVKNAAWIRISLDAATPEMFKLTHGMNLKAFNRVIKNIELLVETKKRIGAECTIGVGYLTGPHTMDDIYKFALLCKTLKVDYAQFRPLLKVYGGKKIDYSTAVNREIIAGFEKTVHLSGNGYRVLYSKHKYDSMLETDGLRMYKKCYGHHFTTVIGPDKKMYVCCHLAGIGKYCIGDLDKTAVGDIWRSELRKKAYENINLKDCPDLCRCNTFNTILWNIKQEKVHPNFI